MIIEDGVLENIKEIRGRNYSEGLHWRVNAFPQVYFESSNKPNIWVRFWQRVLFGWKWEYK